MIDAHSHLQMVSGFPKERIHILADFDARHREKMLTKTRAYPNAFCVIGTHPWRVGLESIDDWANCMDESFIEKNKIVGIGEVGLDFFRAKSEADKSLQLTELSRQIDLAKRYELPLVLHCVRAHQELLLELKAFPFGGMIHGFRSSFEVARQYVEAGFLLSIGPAILGKGSIKLKDVIEKIGLQHLVVESDAQTLEEGSLDKTILTLAEIFKLDIEDFEMTMKDNLERVFPRVKR